jgi:hypothetical protein
MLSRNLLLIIKPFVIKVFMNLFKTSLDSLILTKVVVAKLVLTILRITQSLYSRVVKNLLTKAEKFWSYRKFVRLIAFAIYYSILFYQIIALIITYSKL